MGETTEIAWCDGTVNVWWGCTKVSPACDNCYAETWSDRFGRAIWGPGQKRVKVKSWRSVVRKLVKRAKAEGRKLRVFAQSMSDTFDNEVEQEWRDELFEVIKETAEHLEWLLLTKRIGNVPDMLPADWGDGYPNVWLGISVGDQKQADRDIPKLLEVPAAIHWLSMEPLLDPVELREEWLLGRFIECPDENPDPAPGEYDECEGCPGWGKRMREMGGEYCGAVRTKGIDWVVVGGESGKKARGFSIDGCRRIVDTCQAYGVKPFVKQMGNRPFESRPAKGGPVGTDQALASIGTEHPQRPWFKGWTLTHTPNGSRWYRHLKVTGKGEDPSEWPEDLRVREYPR